MTCEEELALQKEKTRVALEGMRRVEKERDDARALLFQFRDDFDCLRITFNELEDLARKIRNL